ncbi:MAG TPA: phosphoglucosamine mutase [Candidatus Limnocylindrales bacterium]|nr:phosphoglucosamine mutase [Candidatus Limnocylindrales bacterium]
MAKQLFGTDGIRGVAGEYPLDGATVYAFGCALGEDLIAHRAHPEVVIGTDTRESGQWIAETVAGGLQARGVGVRFAGVITTPGVAYLTRTLDFAAGVMISASHNPYHDNGLKVFSHSGFKLPDDEEHVVEQSILALREQGVAPQRAALAVDESLDRRYLEFLIGTVSVRFDGVKIAIDCGNGASYRLAPELFRKLGAEVVTVCTEPDGRNINLNCGALHLGLLQETVVASGANYGVAFDGDADRAIFVAASGKVVDGDGVLLAVGRALKDAGHLPENTVVATVMSNLGLEKALERHGIRMLRTAVGDKYVLEEMVRLGATLGGEQSGHVIFREFATTGDGLLTALRVFEIARAANLGLDELVKDLQVFPQKLVNIRVREKAGLLERPAVASEIRRVEEAFAGSGRVLVRFSGTEPLARVMVEGPDQAQVDAFSASIAEAIRRETGL